MTSINRRNFIQGAAAACATLSGSAPALAQADAAGTYPNRPVTLLAPFPPGGVTDVMVRRISQRFQAITGQPLLIVNKPGRTNALVQLITTPPDGYTLSMVGRSQLINHWMLGDQVPYKAVDDFTWTTTLVTSYFGVLVNASSPIRSVNDLVAAAKARKNGVSYGTAFGVGGLTHAPMHDFERAAGIAMTYVPYKGDVESIRALMGGEVDVIVSAGSAMPYVDDGKFRLLGWLSGERHPRYPNVPTFKELGYPAEAYSIVGLGGPKGMAPAVNAKIAQLFAQIISEPQMAEFLLGISQKPTLMGPDEFTAWARQQLPKEREILARFNLLPGQQK